MEHDDIDHSGVTGAGIQASLVTAKGDLIAATGSGAVDNLAVGANDTILMADSGQSTGLKWVAAATPTTQDYDDVAAAGTSDTFARGDHLHGMPSAGAGAPWTTDVSESGASLANWTQESGSWSVVSSAFEVTTPANTAQRLRLTAQKRQVGLIYQASVSMLSTGGFSGSRWCGLLYGWDGGTTGGTFIGLQSAGTPTSDGVVYVEPNQGIAAGGTIANTFSFDTFYVLTVVTAADGRLDFYIAGSYVGTWGGGTSDAAPIYIALLARNCSAQFKLIKSSYLSLPTLPL